MKNLDKSTFLQISGVFGLGTTLTSERFSEKSTVIHLNKPIFRSIYLQKLLTYEFHFFSEHYNIHVDIKKSQKMHQKYFRFLGNLI